MNSRNHTLIGTVVYEYIKEKYGVVLDQHSFLKGNTCPDHGVSFLRPHRIRYCNKMIQRKTARLCNSGFKIVGSRASKRFGILCHYYSDFFCCAHTSQFEGNLKAHVRYENELLHFMEENYSFFREIDYIGDHSFAESAEQINERMRGLIREKRISQTDYAMELICAIQTCAELVLSIYLTVLAPLEETAGRLVSPGIA